MLVVLSAMWGGSFLFGKFALSDIPPASVAALRIVLGGALLYLVVRARHLELPADRRSLRDFAVLGLLNTVIPFALILWAQQSVPVGLAATFMAATPISTLVLAHLLTRDEPLTGRRAAGALVGLVGVALLVGPDALQGLGDAVLPQLACVAATVCYGYALIWGRRFRGQEGIVVAAGQFVVAAPFAIAYAALADSPWTLPAPGLPAIASIAGLVLISTVVAYVVYFRILAGYGAGNASLVTMLVPVSAMALGAAVLGEIPEPLAFGGFLVIAFGLSLIDGRLFERG